MKKIILQIWEESSKKDGIIQDGCSLHIDINNRNEYIDSMKIDGDVPDIYQRPIGKYVLVSAKSIIYNAIKNNGVIRLAQHEMNNLLKLKEITTEDA